MARTRRGNKTETVLNNILGTEATEEVVAEQRSFATTEEDAKVEREAAATQQESVEKAETTETEVVSSVAGKPSEEEIYKFLEKVGDKISYDSKSTREVAVVRTAVAIVLSSENVRNAFLRVVDSGLQDWLDRENLQSGTPEYKEIELVAYHFEGGPAAAIVTWDKPNAFLTDALWVAFQESKLDEGIEKFYDSLTDFDDECGDGAKEFFQRCEEIVPAIQDELTHFRKTPVLLGSKDPECVESASEFHANILSKLAAFLIVRNFFDDVKVRYDTVTSIPAQVEESGQTVVGESVPHGKSAKTNNSVAEFVNKVMEQPDMVELLHDSKGQLTKAEELITGGDVSPKFVVSLALKSIGAARRYASAKELLCAYLKDEWGCEEADLPAAPDVIYSAIADRFGEKYPKVAEAIKAFTEGKFDHLFNKDAAAGSSAEKAEETIPDDSNSAPSDDIFCLLRQVPKSLILDPDTLWDDAIAIAKHTDDQKVILGLANTFHLTRRRAIYYAEPTKEKVLELDREILPTTLDLDRKAKERHHLLLTDSNHQKEMVRGILTQIKYNSAVLIKKLGLAV